MKSTKSDIPINAGKPWSSQQHNDFLTAIKEIEDIDHIASKLGRSSYSIICRLRNQIYNWIEIDKKDINWVVDNTPYKTLSDIEDIAKEVKRLKISRKAASENKKIKKWSQKKKIDEISNDINKIKNDITELKLMMRGMMAIIEELTIETE